MNRTIVLVPTLLLFAAGILLAQVEGTLTPIPKVTITRWPQDRTATISLTFDDGMNTHLDIAGPILRKHHLNGTFFIATGLGPWEKRLREWKKLAEEGNELGFHTVHHPCLLEEIQPHGQDYTAEMMENEVRESSEAVSKVVGDNRGLTFAFPCGDLSFGKPADQARNSALYLRYVSEYAIGARTVGAGSPQDPDDLSILTIPDLGPTEGKTFSELVARAEPAVRLGYWGVLCFHGVGGEYLSVTAETLDQLSGYLERHPEIWTATFGDALRYTQERKASTLRLSSNSDQSIEITVEWPLNARIFDLPLTLKVEFGTGWHELLAVGDGKLLPASPQEGHPGVFLLDVVPETHHVHIFRPKGR